jgi:hypothetical protein
MYAVWLVDDALVLRSERVGFHDSVPRGTALIEGVGIVVAAAGRLEFLLAGWSFSRPVGVSGLTG